MDIVESNALYFRDYEWKEYEQEDPRVSGKLDSTDVDRKDGRQVTFLIGEIMRVAVMKEEISKVKLEKIIRHELPKNIAQQDRIKIWVLLNWFNSKF